MTSSSGDATKRAGKHIRPDATESWEQLCRSHTAIFTTLRRDGSPVALPVWFVAIGNHVYVRATANAKKVQRLAHDPRASVLVEQGQDWTELRAVHYAGSATVLDIDDPEAIAAVTALDEKYAPFQAPLDRLPEAVRQTYSTANQVIVRFTPSENPALSWDNSRIPLR